MLVIREIQAAEHIGKVQHLLAENWAETGFDFDLRPDIEMMRRLQDAGLMFVLAAFDGDEMVGYSSALISPHTYNPAIVCCNSDALFVHRAWRKTSAGARLIAETERVAAEKGASRMLWHTRAGTPLAASLERRGYTPADVIVMKEI
ncbi:Acetyltransferase (GNAT) family protein [Massilia sp. PDC64]|nr:GNAT family N-acetyltransferase [Massilia sp. PDC64]SDC69463.1 Acetyltransferase (GNAT) family protein [Massilia sp. PDC64]